MLVNVALSLDLFAALSGQEVIDAVTVDHVNRHLDQEALLLDSVITTTFMAAVDSVSVDLNL